MTRDQQRVTTVLERLKKIAVEDAQDAEALMVPLDDMLDMLAGEDFFGTEQQGDPRGDFRDANWSMGCVQGVDAEVVSTAWGNSDERLRADEIASEEIPRLRAMLTATPSVPDGYADEDTIIGAIEWLKDFDHSIDVGAEAPVQSVAGWLTQLMLAMLTATPAPPRSESVVKAEALEDQAEKLSGLAANARENGYMEAGQGMEDAAQECLDDAARLRSEGRE